MQSPKASIALLSCVISAGSALAAPQSSFQDVTADSARVLPQLFQSLSARVGLEHLSGVPERPYAMELGWAYLYCAEDVAHMRDVLEAAVLGEPSVPSTYGSLDRSLARLEEGMLVLGGDLFDDGALANAQGLRLCAQGFRGLASDFLDIDPAFARATWNLGLAEDVMLGAAAIVEGTHPGSAEATAAANAFTSVARVLQDVGESLLDAETYNGVSAPAGDGGTAGSVQNGCPQSHPYRGCHTTYTLTYIDPICIDWIHVQDEGLSLFSPTLDVESKYIRLCSWTVVEEKRVDCACYASLLDQFYGRDAVNHTSTGDLNDVFIDETLEFEWTDGPNQPPANDQPADNPGPEVSVFPF